MIVIIDYGIGNGGSILNMLDKIGAKAKMSSGLYDIEGADKLILSGVGAFDSCVRKLSDMNLIPLLNRKVLEDKAPILGVCLGMQVMTKRSEEGNLPGIGWFEARTVKFKFDDPGENMRIPHIGWNTIQIKRNNVLFEGLDHNCRFYFMHSYHVVCDRQDDVLAETFYGREFNSVINKDNIFGVQFHPEKSHKFGMKILRNFANL